MIKSKDLKHSFFTTSHDLSKLFDETNKMSTFMKKLEKQSDINTDYDWFEMTYDDAKEIAGFAKEIAGLMGIKIDKIYFEGFWSQGDGACFEGSYSYAKNSVKKVLEYAPLDQELHRIVKALYAIQKRYFYRIVANVKHSGHYYHSRCTNIEVYNEGNNGQDWLCKIDDDSITELLRDFMNWIYKQLRTEYEYLTSEAQIIETIEANEYEFDEYGDMA